MIKKETVPLPGELYFSAYIAGYDSGPKPLKLNGLHWIPPVVFSAKPSIPKALDQSHMQQRLFENDSFVVDLYFSLNSVFFSVSYSFWEFYCFRT